MCGPIDACVLALAFKGKRHVPLALLALLCVGIVLMVLSRTL